MTFENIITELAIILAGAALLSTLFLFLKQPIIISYIVLGMIIGPYGLGLIKDADHLEKISHVGIILLLFLIGLNLHPYKLLALFKKTALVTTVTGFIFVLLSALTVYAFGYSLSDSLIIGLSLMFSSTVIGLKLISTSDLHNKHIGELIISVLLFQDIIAIIIILFLKSEASSDLYVLFSLLILKGILLSLVSFFLVKYVVLRLCRLYNIIEEYIFLVALAWCLSLAGVANYFGLSYEIGAFVAGVTLAVSPLSEVIFEKLRSLREFFLLLFFFAIGAQFDLLILKDVVWLSLLLGGLLLLLKPIVFKRAFQFSKEPKKTSAELGLRLGQASEFSLIVAYIALENNRITNEASYVIQLTVIITFIVSTYLVSSKYKTS